jgi:serine-aspartate repeat-containing protein C/D/E
MAINPGSSASNAPAWTRTNLGRSQWVIAGPNGLPIKKIIFGIPGAIPVTGDFNGDGQTEVGVFIDGEWFIDLNGDGVWDDGDLWVSLGKPGDKPVTGDWDGDGKTDIGVFGPEWYGDMQAWAAEPGLPDAENVHTGRPKNVPPDPHEATNGHRLLQRTAQGKVRTDLIDHVFRFGSEKDTPVTGDWNGDGVMNIGVFRDGTWYLDLDGDGRFGPGDASFKYGQPGDVPVVGDWTGDGTSKVGVYRRGEWHLDTNGNRELDAHDKVFELGGPNDKPVVGDWDGSGVDQIGVYQDNAAASGSVSSE